MRFFPLFPKKSNLRDCQPGAAQPSATRNRRTTGRNSTRPNLLASANALIVSTLVLLVGRAPLARAENRTVQHLENVEIKAQEVYPVFGLIHGWGFLEYGDLEFSFAKGVHDDSLLTVDVVVSSLPEYDGKDWLHYYFAGDREVDAKFWWALGIGAKSQRNSSTYYTCCDDDAFEEGICEDRGRIIVSDASELKVRTSTKIQPGNLTSEPLSGWSTSTRFDYTTPVVLAMGHCNITRDNAQHLWNNGSIFVDGDLVWMSYVSKTSIPIKFVLAALHLGLYLWYKYKMAQNEPSRIQIEVWLSGVLGLACFSAMVIFVYVSLEAMLSREVLWLRVISDFSTKTTHVVSRCLYVAIALGLGVTKTRLSMVTKLAIAALGLAVLGSKETADVMGDISFARRDNNFGDDFNQERHEFLKMQFKLNMLFLVWIPIALLWTMRSMRHMQVEPQKLQRHRWLWRLYLFSLLLTSGMVGAYLLMRYGPHKGHGSPLSILFRGNSVDRSVVDEICNFAYWITLVCFAVLWKPNPEAPMYGYVLLSEDGENLHHHHHHHVNDAEGGDPLHNHDKNAGNNTANVSMMEMAEYSSSSSSSTLSPIASSTSTSTAPTSDIEEVHHDLSLQVENAEDA